MERTGVIKVAEIEQRPLLTPTQKDTLVRTGLRYLRDSGIQINPKTVNGAGGVILDAFERGLKTKGKPFVTEREGVTTFVKIGLEERKEIQKKASDVVSNIIGLQVIHPEYHGPLAIQTQSVIAARSNLRDFAIQQDIKPSEDLVNLVDSRTQELNVHTNAVISKLPENIATAVKSRELTTDEKAKFIRNVITGIVFTNDASPIITTTMLHEYNKLFNKNKTSYFTKESLEKVQKVFEGNSELLTGLFFQTRETFNSTPSLADDKKDQLFASFRNTLLLLNPAAEEEQISLNPSDIENPSVQTLWDEGYSDVIKGHLIPRREILRIANRQAQAARQNERSKRIYTALRAWNLLDKERESYPNSVQALKAKIEKQKQKVKSLDARGTFVLGHIDLGMANNLVSFAERGVSVYSRIVSQYNSEISESRSRARQLAMFKNSILRWQNEGKPLEIPQEMYITILEHKKRGLSRSITALDNRLHRLRSQVEAELEYYKNKKVLNDEFFQNTTIGRNNNEEMTKYVRELVKRFNKGEDIDILNIENFDSMKYWVRKELNAILSNQKLGKISGIIELSKEEKEKYKKHLRSGIVTPEVNKLITRSVLGRLSDNLENASLINSKLQRLNRKRNIIDQTIYTHKRDNLPVPKEAYKDLNWAFNLYNEQRVSTIPSNIKGKRYKNAKDFINAGNPQVLWAILPGRINKETFKKALETFQETGKRLRRELPSTVQMKLRSESVKRYLSQIDNPLLSLDYAPYISTPRFLELLERKQVLLRRHFDLPSYEEREKKASEELRHVLHQREHIAARLELKGLEADYEKLTKELTPENKFLERMKRLGLAQEINN